MVISLRRLKSLALHVRVARFLALLLFGLLGGGLKSAQASITLVQHTGKDAGTTTTSSLAFVSPNTAGNWIAVSVRGGLSSSQVFTISDSNGNTYKQAAQVGFTGSAVTLAIYYAENIKAGANTVTVSDTVSGPLRFAISEYSGVATANSLDATAVATATSSSPNSGNLTTTVNGDLLLATVGTTNPAAFTAGTGYTIRDFVPVEPNTKLISEDQIQTSAGLASAGASLAASDSWGAVLIAVKAPGGAAGTPTTITATAGTPQSATVSSAFGTQLQATVKDSFNNPVNGATVTFAAPASGASGTFAGGVAAATTNAQGVATAGVFTANTVAGTYTVTASVTGVSSPANFSLTNLAGAAASIAATAGTPQSAAINTAFPTQLQATVKDSFSNPVGGVTVTFTAPANGASGAFAGGVNTATTNAQGVATAAVFTANSTAGGPYTVTASVPGVSTLANFSLTNLAGPPVSIAATAGTPQSATVNSPFAIQLQAAVKDASNNPVNGVTVTFSPPASGASGTFAGGVKTATTNASGVATAAVFTANSTAGGPYTVTASVTGVSTAANFSLTNLAGPPASVTATAGTPQSATINTAFATQLQATVKDASNNPVNGVTVTFVAPASGASGTFAGGVNTAITNASGVATAAVFIANSTAGGPYTVTASVSGVSTPANFSLTNLGNPPASITATAGTPQSATINTAFAAQLQATVKDASNNPVNGVTVTFVAPASGASGTFAGGVNTAITNASGVATAAVFTANSTAGGPYTVTASVSGVSTSANFSLTNLTGPPASITATAGTPQSATINTAFTTQLQATVTDAGNNPVSGVTVAFIAPASGPSGTFASGMNTATTNASGVATAAVLTANSTAGGPYTVTASVTGVSTPANFSLTNLNGPPASIAATAGTPQSANVNTAFAVQLQATVKDASNNPVNGATVTFTAPASGASGTFAGGLNTAITNASGVATAAVFTANSTAGGPYTVTASVTGVSTPASFSLTNVAAAPPNIKLVQHRSLDAGTTTSSSLAFASANTAGNWIAVAIRAGLSSSQVFSVSDSNGNTYRQAAQIGFTSSVVALAIYYAENIKGGANTITVSDTVSGPLRFAILEYSGVATANSLDVPVATATATSSSPNSGNVTTTASGDLLLSAIASTNPGAFTAGSGYTIRDFVPVEPNTKLITEDQIQVSAGVASASATLAASDTWGAVLAAFKAASGGGGTTQNITATGGTPQSAAVNTAFATQLQATVKDSLNNPVSGVTVTFTAPASGASGTFAGGANTAMTNAQGVATAAVFTANSIAGGPYSVTASVSGAPTPGNFSLTNLAGAAASITATAGTPQSATINTAFATQLQATVKDASNNPVSGVTVTFTAPASGASGAFAGGVNTATTNAQGVATAPVFTANGTSGGPYTVTASVSGVATPANFSLTNLSAPPATVTATAGTPQSATVNTAFTTALQATVKDASNNPVSGVTVTFTAPASGASGTFAGGANTAMTNAQGVATAAVFTANSTAGGPYNVTASVSGVASPANFSLTNLAGAAASIAATSGTPQSAAINTAFATQLQATVKDASNNPVNGVTVTFTAPASGASGTFAGGVNTATTNAQGVATAPVFTANGTSGGPYTVTSSVSGVATPANFSLTNVASATVITLVQHTSIDAGTTTTGSLAFKTSNTAGNWIAVCIRGGLSNSQVFTVGDSNANSYHQAFQLGLSSAVTFAIYYAENIKGSANTVTLTQSVSGPLRFAILEYSGVATSSSLDAVPATAQGNSATPNSGNLTTGANGDLLLSAIVTANAGIFTAGSGYTIEEFVPAEPNTKLIAEDQLQRTAGTASASATLAGSDNWGAGLAAFRSISGAVPPISVSVSPATASVPTGYGTQAFTASVANDFQKQGVTWSLSGTGCSGSTCGTLSNITSTSVTYNGPANVPNPATVSLTATAVADTTKSASATITVTLGVLHITVSPRRAAVAMSGPQTVQFTATVTNDPQNLGVTWQVDGSSGGNTTTGTVSTTGLFTPGTQPGQHTVTAVSNANATVSASAMVAVTDLAGVYTHHNDNARTGQNLKEYGLTPATVNSSTFGPLFSCPVDAWVYAQPLWVANLTFGTTIHNVVFVGTENDTVYAFDADSPSCVQLWKVSFLSTGVTPLTPSDLSGNLDVGPLIGLTATPVIDQATNTIYVTAKTRETVGTVNGQTCTSSSPCYVTRLHALDLLTGAEKLGGPVVISAPNFVSSLQYQRPALLLANGTVYLGFGSHGDQGSYSGWLFGYNASNLTQTFVKALTNPAAGAYTRGGVWHSGGGPATDASGNVYIETGNGSYDGSTNFGDSVIKLSPTGAILDWFTPFNQSTMNANDVDMSSSGVLILPDSVGSVAHPHLAIATGKIGILYLLDQANMGKINSSTNNDVQEVIPVPPINTTMADGGNYVDPAYWNGNIYTTGQNFPLSQFQISNGVVSTPQFAKSANTFPPRGGVPSVSANGTTGGIVWIIDYTGWQTNAPSILDAYDATNVGTLLYSSPTSGSGVAGAAVKFTTPTVANGKVYVGTQNSLSVYGLLP